MIVKKLIRTATGWLGCHSCPQDVDMKKYLGTLINAFIVQTAHISQIIIPLMKSCQTLRWCYSPGQYMDNANQGSTEQIATMSLLSYGREF